MKITRHTSHIIVFMISFAMIFGMISQIVLADGGTEQNEQYCTVTFYCNNEKAYYETYSDPGDDVEEPSGKQLVPSTEEQYSIGSILDKYNTPYPSIDQKTGLVFAGYSTNPKATEPDEEIKAADNLQLYAVWEKGIKITHHINNEKANFKMDSGEQVAEFVLMVRTGD